MFCPHCGKEIQSGSHFCPNCGKSISSETKETSDGNTISQKNAGKGKKRKVFKFILIAAAVLVFGSVLLNLSGGGDDSDDVWDSSAYSYEDPTSDEPESSDESETADTTTEEAAHDFSNDATTGTDDTTWTVMLYMCGSNLESDGGAATANMADIAKNATSRKVRFIAQTGGCKQWANGISATSLQRYELIDDSFKLKDEEKLASMGNPKTLSNFIQWGKKKYPADRYMILFWDHGCGAAGGVCFDELFKDTDGLNDDSLSITELAQGLKWGGIKFDVIGFDTCLTATIETEYAISPYGKYCAASEETEPSEGWDYNNWTQYLTKHNDCGLEQFGKYLVDTYIALCQEGYSGDSATLSFVDLSKVGTVYNNFVKMSSEMSDNASNVTSFRQITKGATRAQYFGTRTEKEGYTNMIDLGDLARNTNDVLSDSAQSVLNAISKAVVYEKHGSDRSKSTGLSVFYPVNSYSEELDRLAASTTNGPYLAFIDAMCDYWQAPSWVYDTATKKSKNDIPVSKSYNPVRSKNYSVKFTESISDDGVYSVQITSGLDIVDKVCFDLIYVSSDGNKAVYLGEDDNINADWDKGLFEDNFSGTWLSIGGTYANVNLIEQGDDYNLYSVPVKLNGKETNLRIRYDFNKEKYMLIGAYDGIDESGAVSRKIMKLKDGDELVFIFTAYDAKSDDAKDCEMGKIIWTSGTEIVDGKLKDGDYLYEYNIYDVFGNELSTKGVDMEVKKGDINVYELDDDETSTDVSSN